MPVKYISYHPHTVEGQALLNNLARAQRLLLYRDHNKVYHRLKRGLPWYETEPTETVGADPDSPNLLIRGECLSACAYLKDRGLKVDLVYIDPPFASGANYAKQVHLRQNAQTDLDADNGPAFEETMYGDIWQKEDYLNWMYENLTAIKSVMSDTASIYVHLDWHIGHYVKILLDEIFGEVNFRNEIVWYYPDNFQGNVNGFATNHNSIFWYANSAEYIANKVYIDLPKPVKRDKRIWSKEEQKLVAARDEQGNLIYEEFSQKKADDVWQIGQSSVTKEKSKEFLGYATQKPEELLRRVIEASSDAGMVVADFFGGSGVTAKAAADLGRNFIHVDVGLNSIQTARDRLAQAGASFNVLQIKDGVSLFRNPAQTMDKLAKIIPGLQQNIPDLGKFWFGVIQHSKLGAIPVYVPNLLDHTQKVLDIPAVNRILNEELPKLEIEVQKAVIYYIDIDDRAELEKFIKEANPTLIAIELKDLKAFLDEIILEDSVAYELAEGDDDYRLTVVRFSSDRLQQKIDDYNQKRQLTGKQRTPIQISPAGLELIELVSLDCTNDSGPWHSDSEIKIDKKGQAIVNGVKTKALWRGEIAAPKKPLRLKIRNISGDETIIVLPAGQRAQI